MDALGYRDLSVLARERAIVTAYLLAGDDDLREGVASAQELGVHVTLWGMGANNQARTLKADVDRCARLDDLDDLFTPAPGSRLDVGDLLAPRPHIPTALDAELLRAAQAEHGSLRGHGELRRVLRAGFWAGADGCVGSVQ